MRSYQNATTIERNERAAETACALTGDAVGLTCHPDREMGDRLIYSRHDPVVRRLRHLQTREGREKSGMFLIDGIRPLAQAVQHGACIEMLVITPEAIEGGSAWRLIREVRALGVPCCRLKPEVYHHLSEAEEPQGVAAVVRQRWSRIDQVRPSRGLCWLAAEELQSGGNLGTILRTNEAVGGSGVILIGDTIDPYCPVTVRASMGALFGQTLVRTSREAFGEWKKRRQCLLVGTSPSAERDYQQVQYPNSLVLLLGSERKGVTPELQAMCDLMVRIPMAGQSDSLNVGIAAGVMLYEVFNQRRRSAERAG